MCPPSHPTSAGDAQVSTPYPALAQDPEPPEEYPYRLSTLSGCPMVVIPAGVDRQGLPFGLQIIAKRWGDEQLLVIAGSLSELTGGFRRPPGY